MEVKQPTETAEEKPVEEKVDEKPVEETAKKDDAEEKKDEKPAEPEEKKENHFERRQKRLLQERAEYKAKAEWYEKVMAQQQQQANSPEGKPVRENYQSDAEFNEALVDWRVEQKLSTVKQEMEQSQRQNAVLNDWQKKVAGAKETYEDYDDVLATADDIQLTGPVQEAIMDSEYGPDIAYYMARHPEDAMRIVNLSPTAAVREIGRIEAVIGMEEKGKKPASRATPAPKPINPPKTAGSGGHRDVDSMSPAEYVAYRNDQIHRKRNK